MKSHTGSHQCGICLKTFAVKDVMETHILGHDGERPYFKFIEGEEEPYRCEKCPEKFPDKPGLELHMFAHNGTKAKPSQCHICQETFLFKNEMEKHVETDHPE